MKTCLPLVLWALLSVHAAHGQSAKATPGARIAVDVAHGQAFWGDPLDSLGTPASPPERMRFLASKLRENAESLNAEVVFLSDEIRPADLRDVDVLFIHVPTAPYSASEVAAIQTFVNGGKSLFLVMDEDYWTTLDKTNANDLIRPFGLEFGANSPDQQVGGHTRDGLDTERSLKIPFHGGRTVRGGTPFGFSTGTDPRPFATLKELGGGGRLVVMGDAMAALYMNSWQGVDDYETEAFMQAVLAWLLHR